MLAALCMLVALQTDAQDAAVSVSAVRVAAASPTATALAAPPCELAPRGAAPTTPRDATATPNATLRGLIEHAIEPSPTSPFWGAVLVVWHGEVVCARGYGAANLAGKRVDRRTLFDVGSLSKQFTAAAILQLADARALELSDTLADHFALVDATHAPITIEQLLHHRSGLLQTQAADTGAPDSGAAREDWERHLLSRPVVSAPGAQFRYCNYNYLLLALIVERVSHAPFEQYVRTHVLAPAGMSNTRFVGECDGDASDQSVRRHRFRRPGPPPRACDWVFGYGYRGATGMLCSLDELLAWHRALSDERVLSAPRRATLFAGGTGSYACGWYVQRDDDGRMWHWHDGRSDGYRASMSRCAEEDALVVVLTSESISAYAMDAEIRSLLPRRVAPANTTDAR